MLTQISVFSHTKLLRESLFEAKSTSTNPANDGLYNSLFKEELFKNEKRNGSILNKVLDEIKNDLFVMDQCF